MSKKGSYSRTQKEMLKNLIGRISDFSDKNQINHIITQGGDLQTKRKLVDLLLEKKELMNDSRKRNPRQEAEIKFRKKVEILVQKARRKFMGLLAKKKQRNLGLQQFVSDLQENQGIKNTFKRMSIRRSTLPSSKSQIITKLNLDDNEHQANQLSGLENEKKKITVLNLMPVNTQSQIQNPNTNPSSNPNSNNQLVPPSLNQIAECTSKSSQNELRLSSLEHVGWNEIERVKTNLGNHLQGSTKKERNAFTPHFRPILSQEVSEGKIALLGRHLIIKNRQNFYKTNHSAFNLSITQVPEKYLFNTIEIPAHSLANSPRSKATKISLKPYHQTYNPKNHSVHDRGKVFEDIKRHSKKVNMVERSCIIFIKKNPIQLESIFPPKNVPQYTQQTPTNHGSLKKISSFKNSPIHNQKYYNPHLFRHMQTDYVKNPSKNTSFTVDTPKN